MASPVLGKVSRCLVAVAASAFVLMACSTPAETAPPVQDIVSSATTGTPTAAPESTGPGGAGSVPSSAQPALLRAGQTALAAVAGSTVVAIEREGDERGWEVQAVTTDGQKYELALSPDGRKVLRVPQPDGKDPGAQARRRQLVQAAQLDYRAAVQKIDAARQGTITELELGSERDKAVWKAEVIDASGTKQAVIIDAATGQVLSTRLESRPASRPPSPSTPHH